jgi:hypothetical protein
MSSGLSQLRRGIHHSVAALKVAVNTVGEHHNANPKPFR